MVTGPYDRGNSSVEETFFPGDAMPCLQKLIFTDGFQGCDSSEGGLPSGCPQNSGRRTSFIVKVREGFLEEVVWDERGCFEI